MTRTRAGRWAAAMLSCVVSWSVPASARAEDSVLRLVPQAALRSLDPHATTAYVTRNHGYMVYDTLFAMDEALRPQPQMVERHSVSGDGLTYDFTLRSGLFWHDGAPVTAEDCVASLKRWAARDAMGQRLMALAVSLEPLDDSRFRLVLREPYGLVLESLAKLSATVPFMMPKRLAETDPATPVTEAIGSGPFRFDQAEWRAGDRAIYHRNRDYRPRAEPPSGAAGGKVVKVDRVDWLRMPDAMTAAQALIAGEVDYLETPSADLVPMLRASAGVTVSVLDPLGATGILRPNHAVPPFNQAKARQALFWLADQQEYMAAAVGNPEFYGTCRSYYPCGSHLASERGAGGFGVKDIARARALFQEAGVLGQSVTVLQVTDVPSMSALAQIAAQGLRQAGMQVDLQAMDFAAAAARRGSRDPVEQGGWSLFTTWMQAPDAANPVSSIPMAASCDEKSWFGWPCDPELEAMRGEFARETDPDTRRDIAIRIQERNFSETVTHVPVGTWFNPVAYRDSLKGLIKAPVLILWNVEKDAKK
ncbi:MAG: ABC transporter substrate-binding protein [Alphaproteobacteria bacterium]|nr:ABC transporter substrate-binding protein [Alphaproteobacteria bacterium]MBU0796344.1 ABC transporter substrate-binding protein [Alphaproteobacteria bacterium]MBU0887767.1 ABC transporter substrate-binding protein [Alphaproteobacteria bacterium]MBU1815010.1 ABC transporter substrate-binding protein [Alphaproteobacteria bacterium]